MNKIAVFTSARSEYGSFRKLLDLIFNDSELELCLIVSGTHLSKSDGYTVENIQDDGFPIAASLKILSNDRSSLGFSLSLGKLLLGMSKTLSSEKPDILILLGDRAELLPAATAATCLGIPIAHISGGEITEGAIDDSVRHAVTKLSHLHFPTNQLHEQLLLQMGEEAWRVTLSGEPALDMIDTLPVLSRSDLERYIGIPLTSPVVIVTCHSETIDKRSEELISKTLKAMDQVEATYVITYPNTDPGCEEIISAIESYAGARQRCAVCKSLGQSRFYSLLRISDAMLGNSSSALWEAPSFDLPAVNIGNRQKGRLRADNIIDVPELDDFKIASALRQAILRKSEERATRTDNPYRRKKASSTIYQAVKLQLQNPNRLLRKKIITSPTLDWPANPTST